MLRYDLSLPMQKSPAHLLQQAIDPTDPIGAAWIRGILQCGSKMFQVPTGINRASDWIPVIPPEVQMRRVEEGM